MPGFARAGWWTLFYINFVFFRIGSYNIAYQNTYIHFFFRIQLAYQKVGSLPSVEVRVVKALSRRAPSSPTVVKSVSGGSTIRAVLQLVSGFATCLLHATLRVYTNRS